MVEINKISSFYPPQRTLMGPGPSEIHPRVFSAMGRPTIGYLDPIFIEMMDELKELLRYAFQTKNELTFPVSGPGSAGMEMCFVNMVEPGDKVLVCINGVFGGRMLENVVRCGGQPIIIKDDWGKPVNLNKVEDALKNNQDIKVVAFVHAETSTGVLSDGEAISKLAKKYGAYTIMDTVTSLTGVPVMIDDWGIDASYSGSQKCLSCTPGLSPITFSDNVKKLLQKKKSNSQSWFLDLNLLVNYWGENQQRTYHHTAPTNSLYSLHEALLMLKEEGIEKSWFRHYRHHEALKAGLEALNLEFLVEPDYRLPQMNAVICPSSIDEAEVRKRLLKVYNIEIGAGLGDLNGKIWRFGIMGYSCKMENVMLAISALESIFDDMGIDFEHGKAETAAYHAYADIKKKSNKFIKESVA